MKHPCEQNVKAQGAESSSDDPRDPPPRHLSPAKAAAQLPRRSRGSPQFTNRTELGPGLRRGTKLVLMVSRHRTCGSAWACQHSLAGWRNLVGEHRRAHTAIGGKPKRIVSINLCADQLVLALADRGQIAGLTRNATDAEIPGEAAKAPWAADPEEFAHEQILAIDPT